MSLQTSNYNKSKKYFMNNNFWKKQNVLVAGLSFQKKWSSIYKYKLNG